MSYVDDIMDKPERKGSQGRIPNKTRKGYKLYQKVNVSIDPDTFERLEQYCEEDERSRSWVIQKALVMFLESKGY